MRRGCFARPDLPQDTRGILSRRAARKAVSAVRRKYGMAEQVPAEAQKLQSGMQNPGRQLFSGGKRSRLLRCLHGTISRYEKTYAVWVYRCPPSSGSTYCPCPSSASIALISSRITRAAASAAAFSLDFSSSASLFSRAAILFSKSTRSFTMPST